MVTNDISGDQRMHRICNTLTEHGYYVSLVGRVLSSSPPLASFPFEQKRLKCWFNKGKLFYLEFNVRLILYLLFKPYKIIGAVDLDTLLAAYILSRIKKTALFYDAHEHFTEQFEIVDRPIVKSIWLGMENWLVPKTTCSYTVNESLAQYYKKVYGMDVAYIRNVPVLEPVRSGVGKDYFIYTGAVNEGRGLELLIKCMKHFPHKLYICGQGDILEELKGLVNKLKLQEQVIFTGFLQPDELRLMTQEALLGFNLLDKRGKSYYLSLANKFFDYIHAEIPQVCMDFPEYQKVNEQFEVACLVNLNEAEVVGAITNLVRNVDGVYDKLKNNTLVAKQKYNWQRESTKLLDLFLIPFAD